MSEIDKQYYYLKEKEGVSKVVARLQHTPEYARDYIRVQLAIESAKRVFGDDYGWDE